MGHWLLQGNPAKWRAHEFFADGNQLESWSITRYREGIREGDDVALWLAGRDAGVVALGRVTGPVEDVLGDDDPYWTQREDADAVRMSVPLRLTDVFLDDPVTREELRHDPRFAGAAILHQPFAGNPFPLTDGAWAAILDHHRGSHPPPDASGLDARSHLASLVGRTIKTLSGAPNTVLRLNGDDVIVATRRSPRGQPVPIAESRQRWTGSGGRCGRDQRRLGRLPQCLRRGGPGGPPRCWYRAQPTAGPAASSVGRQDQHPRR